MKYVYMTLLQFPKNEWEDHIVSILPSTTLFACRTPCRTSGWCIIGRQYPPILSLIPPLSFRNSKGPSKSPLLWCFWLHDLLFSMKKKKWFTGHMMLNNNQSNEAVLQVNNRTEPMIACLLHSTNANG